MKQKLGYLFGFILSLSAFIFSVAGQTASPSSTPPKAGDDEVIKVDSRLVVVPVSVTDANGQPVLGLKAQDFRISEDNKPQAVAQVSDAEKVPLEIALLFDVSASTDAMFSFEQETAAKFLQDVMRPEDRAAIFTIGEKSVLLQPLDVAEKAVAAVRTIQPTKEQTAFYDSVRVAADYLQKNSPSGRRKVIVVISDGEDTNSDGVIRAIWDAERNLVNTVQGQNLRNIRVKARDDAKIKEQNRVLKSLQDADTVFYSINPAGSSYQLNKISQFGQSNLQVFASDTGGTAFLPKFQPIDLKDSW
ncbi:MAG: VWA domain-containing protein, partial [Pyrinomonadaceae bacterium]